MRVYALVSYLIEATVEFYPTKEAATKALEEVRGDDPELAALLGVEAVEIGEPSPN